MKIHEFQAKKLLAGYGVPIPRGQIARTDEEALNVARQLGEGPFVLKAQVHAGGRGKAGGIRVVDSIADVARTAWEMLGKTLITAQTGQEGKPVRTLLLEEAVNVAKEIYIGIVIDRRKACPVILASAEGGVEIERLARERPDRVITEVVDPSVGLRPFQASRIFYGLGLDESLARPVMATVIGLYRLLIEKDLSLAEINPFVVTEDGGVVALDAKVVADDNALFRHPDIAGLRDVSQEDPLEVEAGKHNLNYIKLKGNVGCMVNGAGLAMATMDLIKLAGAEPANFLDVGGGATAQMVKEAMRILIFDRDVKMIFINIFGGILRCDTLAQGVVEAARELVIDVPIVVRLEGTNVEEGRRILAGSGLAFAVAVDLADAAKKVGEIAKRVG
ncbi:MAG: Succinyl-CoA ligase (ADP-forming) subunit beta [Syntrophorhabdus sp. PtaB.Bin047]|jgi:succinyl-CoA synthetase beta subunit|nr:MAG: Succinyl-CoA ligase (ADP-forming) subunit beta [Syntrophorhabdus sp. PtaB.Bin047]